jgi:hypothetical protein
LRLAEPLTLWEVQEIPLREVRIAPPHPTLTNCEPAQITRVRFSKSPALFWEVQEMPSREVRIAAPTATNCESAQTTLLRLAELLVLWGVQVIASGEVRMIPPMPTATNCEPDHARLLRLPELPG